MPNISSSIARVNHSSSHRPRISIKPWQANLQQSSLTAKKRNCKGTLDSHLTSKKTLTISSRLNVWAAGPSGTNTRRVSRALLSPPSTSDPTSSSTSSITVAFRDETETENATFEICTEPNSAEALKYIGFSEDSAHSIWENYQNRSSDSLSDLIAFATGQIERCDIAELGDREAMTKMGLNADFTDRMLNPDFSDICGTQTLKYWVIYFLECNYGMIDVMLQRSKN